MECGVAEVLHLCSNKEAWPAPCTATTNNFRPCAVLYCRLHNINREYDTTEEQLSRLDAVIRANVMKAQPGTAV